MIRFGALPDGVAGLIGCWMFLLYEGMVLVLALEFLKKRKKLIIRSSIILIFAALIYVMLQCILGANETNVKTFLANSLIGYFSKVPVVYIILLGILLTVEEIILLIRSFKWYRTHITARSVKDAIDSLPAGICVYAKTGRIILKNISMEKLCNEITGEVLLDGLYFEKKLNEHPSTDIMGGRKVLILSEGTVCNFTKEELVVNRTSLILLTAFDITEEYNKTQILVQKRRDVEELNERLTSYNRDIVSIITSQEILNAKVKIHDELGAGLLSIKNYIVNGGSGIDKKNIIEKLSRNMEFLQSETSEPKQDEYILMFSTANDLDVRIIVDGDLPKNEPDKHIIATAIHECFTNTLRHANGDMLNIKVIEDSGKYVEDVDSNINTISKGATAGAATTVIITNNGNQPVEEIVERGGLVSLRTMVENAGGTMIIGIKNGFELKITLPKEGK